MIGVQARRLAVYLVLAFALVTVALGWWQVVDAPTLAARPDNPEVIEARRSMPRGSIFDVRGEVLASSQVVDGLSRRTYPDPALTHLIGFASLRFGTTGLERVWDDILTGQTDPNPVNDIVDDVLGREPQPRDLTLTVDQRLQDFAAGAAGSRHRGGGGHRPAHRRRAGHDLDAHLQRHADLGRPGHRRAGHEPDPEPARQPAGGA